MKTQLLRLLVLSTLARAAVLGTWTSVQGEIVLNGESAAGTVVAWGRNDFGQSTPPEDLRSAVAIAAGYFHTLVLKQDGTMVAWGNNSSGQSTVPAGLIGVAAIAAGDYHNVALKQDGMVLAWEYNSSGQSTVPTGLSGVTAIAAGGYHSVASKQDSTVVAWGRNIEGQTTVPTGLSGVVTIAAGGLHTVALKQDRRVVAWGNNGSGQSTVPAGLTNVVAIAAGLNHTVVLHEDGTVAAWGNNDYGQTTAPAGLTNVVAIAAGDNHTVALKRDGTVVAWGLNDYGQTTVPAGLSNVVAIAAGGLHTAVIGRLRAIITEQPVSKTVNVGQSVTLCVTATGTGPLSYQWRKEGTNIPAATNATYAIAAVTDSDAGNYSVLVTSSMESVTSVDAVLTVLDTPVFATHPLTQTVAVSSNVTLSATAYGAPPLVFQWYFNGTPIGTPTTGSNVSSYTLTNVQTNQSGNYHVQVFNGYDSATSSDAVLNVVVFPPSITAQPSNQSPLLGHSTSFTVSVSGTPPFRYQWRFNGADIPGATNAIYTVPAVAESDAGNYSVQVANSAGNVTSDNATLRVIVPPSLRLELLAGYPLLSLNGMLGSNFNVQYAPSPASTNWVNLRSISNLSANPFQFLDAAGSTQSARYYRALMQ